ncbi:MAG TPA: ORF6N domain-containing protein [Candidatus Omnitrophota bacterium]|nr:ORF6N domain-containing protein [Candidatus Omnitrophota bacterium]
MSSNRISTEIISNKILLIRGQKVMLDKELALLYEVKPIALRQQVSRNKERFPKDFCFQLNDDEVDLLVSQSVIPSKSALGGHNPYAFTEQGVAMLSSVLRSKRAILVNVAIMRAFVSLRETLSLHKELAVKLRELEQKVGGHENAIQEIFRVLEWLRKEEEKPKGKIGFLDLP